MYKNHKVVAILQARTTSSRLPGKVLYTLLGKPVIQIMVERLKRSKYIDTIVIATTTNKSDDCIAMLCEFIGCKCYRGSEEDVLQRVLDAAHQFEADIIVELTADCPCVDSELADMCIEKLAYKPRIDYVSNVMSRTFARGLDVQVFWTYVLEEANLIVDNPIDRQHVSTYIYKNPRTQSLYLKGNVTAKQYNTADVRLCLDTKEDYELLQEVFKIFGHNNFGYKEIYELFQHRPELKEINKNVEQKDYYKELEDYYRSVGNG